MLRTIRRELETGPRNGLTHRKNGESLRQTATPRSRRHRASFRPYGHLYALRGKRRAVRLQLHALAYNLANFLRTAATSEPIERWSLTSLCERLIKTGTRLVCHARYAVFQMAEAALPRSVFGGILGLINGLRGPPAMTVPA